MFYYIYYTLYKLTLLSPSKNEMPEHITNTVLSTILSFNIITIAKYLKLKGKTIGFEFMENRVYYAITFIVLIILGYFIFIRKKKFIQIEKKFDATPLKFRIVGFTLVTIYILFSIISLFLI
ncbi:MAG: hypothetical protein CMH48_07650 [Muricauda sp.]|nr:hypothetical protein [Allomuricauda sp.]|tara:strand:- start:92913 stop:93278 length:366 start_codon:yes stop_codon:yes gene_type:complete